MLLLSKISRKKKKKSLLKSFFSFSLPNSVNGRPRYDSPSEQGRLKSEKCVDYDEINMKMNLLCIFGSYYCSHWNVSKPLKLIPAEELGLS